MTGGAFDARAARYDAWYDSEAGKAILPTEVACLRPLLHSHPGPYLEVGVGSGRFAQALGVEYGVDPAPALLRLARARGIRAVMAAGEELPFSNQVFSGVLIALTLCFVKEPARVLEESKRVLRPGGGLVLGMIPKGSPWAESYTRKGKIGHPIYSQARFFTVEAIQAWLRLSGFQGLEYRSCLFQPPGLSRYLPEGPLDGYHRSAGFLAVGARRGGA